MKGSLSSLERLMIWYQSNCDGDWEHQHGIEIGSLDNPGWYLHIHLEGTPKADSIISRRLVERSETDWVDVEVKDNMFKAHGGPGNLTEVVDMFLSFLEGTLSEGTSE